jgi:signal peptidase I
MVSSAIETPDSRQDRLRPRLHRQNFLQELARTVLFVVVVTVLFDMAIPRSLVDGRSMETTFFTGDRLIVSRLHYMLDKPKRGEIVVFNSINPREREQGIMLIKRVIGLPNERIEFLNSQLYIDGILVEEPYIKEACAQFSCPDALWQLSDNQYFVMGDNRNASQDSRRFGAITINDIVGEAVFRYWPPQKIGLITGYTYPNP